MKKIIRCGIICKKAGMSQIFDSSGRVLPVTLLSFEDNYIIDIQPFKDQFFIKTSAFTQKSQRISKSVRGVFSKANIKNPKAITKQWTITNLSNQKVGDIITIDHFKEGQFVDVQGTTIGKGFSGTMKRHNFGGLEATHGVSLSHRSAGSTGQCQDPGKVFKGKKMAGRQGSVRQTMQNLRVIEINREHNLIILKGSVPGHKNNYILVTDAVKKL